MNKLQFKKMLKKYAPKEGEYDSFKKANEEIEKAPLPEFYDAPINTELKDELIWDGNMYCPTEINATP